MPSPEKQPANQYLEQQKKFEKLTTKNVPRERAEFDKQYEQELARLSASIQKDTLLEERVKKELLKDTKKLVDFQLNKLHIELSSLSIKEKKALSDKKKELFQGAISLLRDLQTHLDTHNRTSILRSADDFDVDFGKVQLDEYEKNVKPYLDTFKGQQGKVSRENVPQEHIVQDLQSFAMQKGFSDSQGNLTSQVNSLRIEQILPSSLQKATIIVRNSFNGATIQRGIPLVIERKGNSFVFEGTNQRVKIYAGDRLIFEKKPQQKVVQDKLPKKPPEPEGKAKKEPERGQFHINRLKQQMILHSKKTWMPLNMISKEKQGEAVCARYVQTYLAGMYGYNFLKQSGLLKEGKNFQDAWMIADAVTQSQFARNVESADFTKFYKVDKAKQSIRLDTSQKGYNQSIESLFREAASANSQNGLLLFHYKHTKANPQILKAGENASFNSHATILLGWGERSFNTIENDCTLATSILNFMKKQLGGSFDKKSWDTNKYMLKFLRNVSYEGRRLVFMNNEFVYQDTGEVVKVQPGKSVSYSDIQLTDFYHNETNPQQLPARIVGLTELMIQGNFEPVKLLQWDKKKVDIQLDQSDEQFIVGDFKLDNRCGSYEELKARLEEEYDNRPELRRVSKQDFLNKTITFLKDVQVIQVVKKDDGSFSHRLPSDGSIIPLIDWSQNPERLIAKAKRLIKEHLLG